MGRYAHLAIDLGAESGRAIVGVLENDRLALHEVHRFPHEPLRLPSGLHWNLTGLWSEVLEGIRKALAWTASIGLRLESLAVDTWGVDWGLIGKSGELLGLPRAYRDERSKAAFDHIIARIGAERLYDATGNQLMALNTLYQFAAHCHAEPEVVAPARRLLFMPDLFNFFLTGRTVVEATIASTGQMIDPRTGRWAIDLLEEIGLPHHVLGELIQPGTILGELLPHVVSSVGAVGELQVIAPASHDTASAVAAVPADPATKWCYLSSGTWSCLGAEVDRPCITPAGRDALFTNEAGPERTIRFLKNLVGLWLVQECRRAFAHDGREFAYADLISLAEVTAPFRTLLDTSYAPLMSAGDMPEKVTAFARTTGQPEPRSPGEFTRCCLESLALAYRATLAKLEELLDRRFGVIHIVGGGSRNDLLNQMTADATGRRVVAGPTEATACGNVMVQAIALGHVDSLAAARSIIGQSTDLREFAPVDTEAWNAAAARFEDARV